MAPFNFEGSELMDENDRANRANWGVYGGSKSYLGYGSI